MSEFDWIAVAVLAGFWTACLIGSIVILVRAARRPIDERDDRYSAIDDELSQYEQREKALREQGLRNSVFGGWRT